MATLSLALLLTGCAGQVAPQFGSSMAVPASPSITSESLTPSAVPNADPNAAGCKAFAKANNQLSSYMTDGKKSLTAEQWKAAEAAAVNEMDKAGLTTTGTVKERITALVSTIPADPTDMELSTGRVLAETYNTTLDRIANACAADGATVSLSKVIPAPKF
ncbi:hypothetical protein IV500_18450 [Paeniglutamicibacter antarcticus]|uniref:Uncharacterized protein n=1 Tax=Arthrobacter terrae TaxID=2935737 RepID=A0A931CRZ7_9MICC|nr:hypothetical protein [Arthrobacter terrae]MBG0741350.1 hypothetical protein [Arthrobacter terrae]